MKQKEKIIEEVLKKIDDKRYKGYLTTDVIKAIRLTIQKRDKEVLKLIDEIGKEAAKSVGDCYWIEQLKQKIKEIK